MKRVLLATVSALVVATAAFLAFILPAEFGIDPTGVGGSLGLTGLGGSPAEDLHRTDARLVQDFREFELAPFESVELKYDLAVGDGFVYAWSATGEVVFDVHAEPEGAEPGVAESFAQGRDIADAGTYVARFAGIHGWFWENRGATTVTVRLRTSGFATGATRYHDGMAQPLEMAIGVESRP
ncbi:MAG: hypothetical protein OXU77_12950 [Gammaproteobacteria bacterium]|nr:hypothetical protein [Gammaproteobacteria bacterium]MDE0444597.1 hypothetical protein [Gammaproteobacteria bacterium]